MEQKSLQDISQILDRIPIPALLASIRIITKTIGIGRIDVHAEDRPRTTYILAYSTHITPAVSVALARGAKILSCIRENSDIHTITRGARIQGSRRLPFPLIDNQPWITRGAGELRFLDIPGSALWCKISDVPLLKHIHGSGFTIHVAYQILNDLTTDQFNDIFLSFLRLFFTRSIQSFHPLARKVASALTSSDPGPILETLSRANQ